MSATARPRWLRYRRGKSTFIQIRWRENARRPRRGLVVGSLALRCSSPPFFHDNYMYCRRARREKCGHQGVIYLTPVDSRKHDSVKGIGPRITDSPGDLHPSLCLFLTSQLRVGYRIPSFWPAILGREFLLALYLFLITDGYQETRSAASLYVYDHDDDDDVVAIIPNDPIY